MLIGQVEEYNRRIQLPTFHIKGSFTSDVSEPSFSIVEGAKLFGYPLYVLLLISILSCLFGISIARMMLNMKVLFDSSLPMPRITSQKQ